MPLNPESFRTMRKKPRILNTETLARTRLFHVEALELEFSNGVRTRYERLKAASEGGAVLVVPMLDEDTVLMIREYSAGVHRYELTLPKGRVEAGEEPLAAANRELMEEIGHGAHRLEHLTTFTLAPGYLGHTTQVVLARDLYAQKLEGDEPEELEVVPWRLSELHTLVACEECTEARSIAALFMARERLLDER
jgi:ADP-ribose diphosphatase